MAHSFHAVAGKTEWWLLCDGPHSCAFARRGPVRQRCAVPSRWRVRGHRARADLPLRAWLRGPSVPMSAEQTGGQEIHCASREVTLRYLRDISFTLPSSSGATGGSSEIWGIASAALVTALAALALCWLGGLWLYLGAISSGTHHLPPPDVVTAAAAPIRGTPTVDAAASDDRASSSSIVTTSTASDVAVLRAPHHGGTAKRETCSADDRDPDCDKGHWLNNAWVAGSPEQRCLLASRRTRSAALWGFRRRREMPLALTPPEGRLAMRWVLMHRYAQQASLLVWVCSTGPFRIPPCPPLA